MKTTKDYFSIKSPTGKVINLEKNISLQEKMDKITELTIEVEQFCIDNPKMWNKPNTRNFFDTLANYVLSHVEREDENED